MRPGSDAGAPVRRGVHAASSLRGREHQRAAHFALGQQLVESGQVVVALDQRRARPDARDQPLVERPDLGRDRRVVRIDQQRVAELRIRRVAGEVNLHHRVAGKRIEIGLGRIARGCAR